MSTAMDFHSHIASIMEVLTNAAVAEMCKVVEDGYALVHLEMSRSQKENEYLRRKIRGLELQTARYRAERGKAAEGSSGLRYRAERGKAEEGSSGLRYRAERGKAAEGSSGLRYRAERGKAEEGSSGLRYRAERGKAAEGSSGLRYRAERGKAAEGSSGVSRARSPPPLPAEQGLTGGPSLQCRTRFLNRDPGTQQFVQKILSINLDQDPDHEVVTTTKTESAEPEEEGKLLIIKVEGTMETGTTNHEAPVDTRTSSRGDAYTTTSLPATTTDARQHSETEGQRCLRSTSSAHHEEEKMHEVQGVTPEKHSPSQTLLGWQESSQTEDRERSSCSTYTAETVAGEASFSRVRTNLASGITTISKRPQCDMNQASPATKLDTMGIKSLPCAAEDSCGGDDGAEEVTPLIGQDDTGRRSQYQPLLCIQISELPSEVMFEGNATYSLPAFNSPLVSMGAVDSQQQQIQHSWSGIRPMDNGHFSSQNHLYQASSNQNQESGSAQSQQPCLPYACTFCSRRYAHLSKLRLHERFHRGEKPHQCIQCGKSFVQACSLKRHQMVHTGERPFPCPHCGKQFSTSTNLKVHQSIHTGEKSFHCSKCGKNFSFLSNLIKHRALHTAKQSKFHRDQSAL